MSVPRLVIDGYIGEQDPFLIAMGINEKSTSASDVQAFLNANKTAPAIEIEIRSNGGSVTTGFNIYDLLVTSRKKVTTIGFNVKSIATVIFMAGSTRKISENAEFLIHNPWIDPASLGGSATADLLQKVADDMKMEEDRLFNFYSSKLDLSGKDGKDLKKLMDADSSLSVADVLDWGFATEVLTGATAIAPMRVFAYSDFILNTIKTNSNMLTKEEANKEFGVIKSMLNKVVKAFKGEVKAASVTLEDGTTVLYHDGDLAVDTVVFADEAMTETANAGEYILDDGRTVVIADSGVVAEIREAAAADETAALQEEIAALKLSNTDLLAQIEAANLKVEDSKKEIEAVSKALSDFEAKHISVEPKKVAVTAQAFSKDAKVVEENKFAGFTRTASKRYGKN